MVGQKLFQMGRRTVSSLSGIGRLPPTKKQSRNPHRLTRRMLFAPVPSNKLVPSEEGTRECRLKVLHTMRWDIGTCLRALASPARYPSTRGLKAHMPSCQWNGSGDVKLD